MEVSTWGATESMQANNCLDPELCALPIWCAREPEGPCACVCVRVSVCAHDGGGECVSVSAGMKMK